MSGISLHDSYWQVVILTGSTWTEPLGLWCCIRRLPGRTAAKGALAAAHQMVATTPWGGFHFFIFVDLWRRKLFCKKKSKVLLLGHLLFNTLHKPKNQVQLCFFAYMLSLLYLLTQAAISLYACSVILQPVSKSRVQSDLVACVLISPGARSHSRWHTVVAMADAHQEITLVYICRIRMRIYVIKSLNDIYMSNNFYMTSLRRIILYPTYISH